MLLAPSEAVRKALVSEPVELAITWNVAVVVPPPETELGTVSAEIGELLNAIPANAGLDRVTVQLAMLPGLRVVGVHWRLVIDGAFDSWSEVDFIVPFKVTATCAVSSASTALMKASNVPLVVPARIEKAAGTLTCAAGKLTFFV